MKKTFLIVVSALLLAGCATTARYYPYTGEQYPSKPSNYLVTIYSASVHPPTQSYRVIGRVDIQGYASDGAAPGLLTQQAEAIARKKGADAIINANNQSIPYTGTYVIPGHFGYYYYYPPQYVPYRNTLLEFTGDLAVFTYQNKQ